MLKEYYNAFKAKTFVETIVLENDWSDKIDIIKEINHIPDTWKITVNYYQYSNTTTVTIISA